MAACYKVPCPSDSQANDTTSCVAACPQGSGTPKDTDKYASCQASCYSSHFFPASATGSGGSTATSAKDADATATDESSSDDKDSDSDNSMSLLFYFLPFSYFLANQIQAPSRAPSPAPPPPPPRLPMRPPSVSSRSVPRLPVWSASLWLPGLCKGLVRP